jgi:hypothetical protein
MEVCVVMRRLMLAAILAIVTMAVVPTGAEAAGSYVSPGWYGSLPGGVDKCSGEVHLAYGSDRQPMRAKVCIMRTGTNSAQSYVVLRNYSRSSAAAVAVPRVWGRSDQYTTEARPLYTCGGKTLQPYATLVCAGSNAWFSPGNYTAQGLIYPGQASVNGYGFSGYLVSPEVRLY